MNRIARMAKVQASKVNANCSFLFDACNRLMSLPCVLVIATKPAAAFCSAKAVKADKTISAILIKRCRGFPCVLTITYKFATAKIDKNMAVQLAFFARRVKCEDCSESNSY